jgi:hypothetical protein
MIPREREAGAAVTLGSDGRWRIALLATIVVLFIGTSMPGSLKASIEGQFWHGWPWSGSAHFGLFALIAAIPAYGEGRWRIVRVMALAVCLAAATEFVQQFVPGRHPLVRDALIDLTGAITGLTFAARRRW